jgi:hypothetical protein
MGIAAFAEEAGETFRPEHRDKQQVRRRVVADGYSSFAELFEADAAPILLAALMEASVTGEVGTISDTV